MGSVFLMATVCLFCLSCRIDTRPKRRRKVMVYSLCGLLGSLIGFLLIGSWQGMLLGSLLGSGGGMALVRKFKTKIIEKRKKQLSESLLMLSNLLAAGFNLSQAMATVARETPSPLREEWQLVLRQVELGVELPRALAAAARRLKEEELALAAIALGIQERRGGSIVKMLAQTASTIRQRSRLAGRIRILTAQGKLTATIVMVLPVLLIIAERALAPELWRAFFQSPQGLPLLLLAAFLQFIGSLLLFRIAAPN